MKKDDLGTRMKMYEAVTNHTLVRKLPVIGRIDGKAFHTLTRGMERPWDDNLMACMNAAALALCKEAQGCKLAYVQSDEISLLLTDTEKITTQPWFGYETRKLCSIAAATATAAFIIEYIKRFPERAAALSEGHGPLPRFDARFWNLPENEVPNYFLWRQQDAIRNSKQMLGRAHFSHKQLHGLSSNEICAKLAEEHGVIWHEFPAKYLWGTTLVKEPVQEELEWPDPKSGEIQSQTVVRNRWISRTPMLDREQFFAPLPGYNHSIFKY